MSLHIRIGTRGSKLALWQAEYVANQLHNNGITTDVVVIETKGDKMLNKPLAEIGSKGLFTEEIENQLLLGNIDIAVHSAKDLQSTLPREMEILAFCERELPNDVVISHNPNFRLADVEKKLKVGTSSARRKAMLKMFYPHIEVVESRGNLQTRIRKMEDGICDALILAYAGVHRMQYDNQIVEILSKETFTPAVGQGSIAIECASGLSKNKKELVANFLNHEITSVCISAERAFLKRLEGGCSIPLFCLATIEDNTLYLNAGIIHPDGSKILREKLQGSLEKPAQLGIEIAEKLIEKGATKILDQIRK